VTGASAQPAAERLQPSPGTCREPSARRRGVTRGPGTCSAAGGIEVSFLSVPRRVTVCEMPADRPPVKVVVLVVLAAVGVCMIAATMMVSDMLGAFGGWLGVVVGSVLLTSSLAGLWIIQRARDRTLR
jgi:hypothetical protein